MDEKSLFTLEFDKIRARLGHYASFSAGAELIANLKPTSNPERAERRQAETAEARRLFDEGSDIRIGGARDVRPAVENAIRGYTLPAEDLMNVRATIVAGRTLHRQLTRIADRVPHLAAIAELIEQCPGIVSAIGETLDERGDVLDSASPALADIRRNQRIAHGRIQDKLQSLLSSSNNQYLQEAIVTLRGGRYVVPLKAEYKGRIKGIVHDQSGSGATLWIEPANTVELNNDYRRLLLDEREEIERILAALSARVAEQGDAIKRVVERLAELDLVFARASYGAALKAITPEFVSWRTFPQPKAPRHAKQLENWTPPAPNLHPGSTIWLKGARHPLLDPESVVPTDITLDDETFLVLITGPNTGGKTVSLKTTGLMVLMAQSGLQLPVVEARLTVFSNVFADIGDEQSIEQSLSTFSGHVTNISRILNEVDERTLVLFDELGSGTDPAEGAALAQAIVNFLRDKGVTTFVATHYPELKAYATQTPGATNASLLFDIGTLTPTYEMTIGLPGRSNAVAIARRLGLDETILDDALQLLGTGSERAGTMLDSIYELRDKTTAEEAAARLARRRAEEAQTAVEARLADIDGEREALLAAAQAEAQAELAEVRDEIRRLRRKIRAGDAGTVSLNELKRISREVASVAEKNEARRPEPARKRPSREGFQPGDTVQVQSLNMRGQIINISGNEAMVAIGRLHTRADLSDLVLKERAEAEPAGGSAGTAAGPSPGMQLDLRGQRVDEGLAALDRYLDAAYLAQLPWVRVIHGKGTGRMRTAVRQMLTKNKYVINWEEGRDGEGGAGVTVARFKTVD